MARILEDMTPLWEPGTRWGYHLATFGALVGELIRRVDPAGRSIGAYFRDELAAPLGLSLSFGWREDRAARAHMDRPALSQVRDAVVQGPFALWRSVLSPLSLLHRTVREIPDIDMNDPDWLRLEFPSANGVGEVRAVAKLYSSLANDPGELGISAQCMADLTAAPDVPPNGCRDQVMGVSSLWHLGFIRPNPDFDFSPSSRAFGMPGFGGSFGFCDPANGIGYAYAPNRLGLLPFDDPREKALRAALYEAIER
jgi:CubicO group peptidase (beta-lactamase class C family)